MQNQPSHIQSDDASAVMNISFSSLLGEQNKLQFMVPSKQPLVHSDVVHHKAIMTSGPLHAEQQLAADLSHEAINDLVRLRPDYVVNSGGKVYHYTG